MAPARPIRSAVLATALYLAGALWSVRAILPAPASTLAHVPVFGEQLVPADDEYMVVWQETRNAHALLTAPGRLVDTGQCYPFGRALTLGEHMLGEAVLGVIPYWATREPLFTHNAVATVMVWIAAVAMWVLVFYWTRSASAALVAGFLFGFYPTRIGDTGHPFVNGNQWTPLALLFAHRLFVRRRWIDAAGLACFTGLQTLESFYPLVAFAIIGGVYGLYLVTRNLRTLPSLLPKLAAVVGANATIAAVVLRPYLVTRAIWGIPGARVPFFLRPDSFALGGLSYPGTVMLVFAAIAVLDRLRGSRPRDGYDPRLVYLAGGIVVFWGTVSAIPTPFRGVYVPSLWMLAHAIVPGLDAVRAGGAIRSGVYLVGAFLAGYGVWAITDRRGPTAQFAITAAILVAGFIEVFYPPVARYSFAQSVEAAGYVERPPAAVIGLYRDGTNGAVLDLPFRFDRAGTAHHMPYYLFLSAYHGRPVGACFDSYRTPIQDEVEALANRLPDVRAADALCALGFRTILVHEELFDSPSRAGKVRTELGALTSDGTQLVESGRAPGHTAFRLECTTPVEASFAALAATTNSAGIVDVVAGVVTLNQPFRNGTNRLYRHPDPIEPTRLLARWYRPGGEMVAQHSVTALLPLALARGEDSATPIKLPAPAANGVFQLTLAPAATPDLVLARRTLMLFPSTSRPPKPAA